MGTWPKEAIVWRYIPWSNRSESGDTKIVKQHSKSDVIYYYVQCWIFRENHRAHGIKGNSHVLTEMGSIEVRQFYAASLSLSVKSFPYWKSLPAGKETWNCTSETVWTKLSLQLEDFVARFGNLSSWILKCPSRRLAVYFVAIKSIIPGQTFGGLSLPWETALPILPRSFLSRIVVISSVCI